MLSRRVQKSLDWLNDDFPPEPKYPPGPVLAMNSAKNWLCRPDILPIMRQAIQSGFHEEHLSYSKHPGGPEDLLQAASLFFNHFFAPRVHIKTDNIVTGAGAASLLDSLDFAICELDEGLLIDAPMWEGFGLASTLRNDNRLIPVPRPPPSSSAEEICRHYFKAMEYSRVRIRGIIVCNPQNPYGHIYPKKWLETLLQFCETQDIHYVSDEIYGMSVFGRPPGESSGTDDGGGDMVTHESPEATFRSVLSMDLKRLNVNPARVHTIWAISKDLGSSGLRLGFLVTQQNMKLRYALWILNRYRLSSASAVIGSSLLSDLSRLETILGRNNLRLRDAATLVTDFLTCHRVSFYKPVAGCFIWARLGGNGNTASRESDARLWQRLARERVAVATGSAFHETSHGWFRITFALPQDVLVEGLRRIERALEVEKKWRGIEEPGQGWAKSSWMSNQTRPVAKASKCTVM